VGGRRLRANWASKGKDRPMSVEEEDFFKRKDLVSVGLAVGYFYNFLNVFYENIEHTPTIELFDKPEDKEGHKYDTETIEVQVILPKRLDDDAFRSCEKDFGDTKKGSIFLHKQKRYYGINYILAQQGLIVLDLARPLMAVKPFYEDILK